MAATVTRTGEHSLSDGRQGLAVRETYEVLLETPSAIGHLQAKNAPGLPYWGQRHPNHATLVVIDRAGGDRPERPPPGRGDGPVRGADHLRAAEPQPTRRGRYGRSDQPTLAYAVGVDRLQ